jgi:hypothetical protein
MTKAELIELINSWENLPYLVNEIAQTPEYYEILMEIALYDPSPKSWRAAYLVDKINDNFPELLYFFLNKMIEQVQIEKSESKRRHFLKLISMNDLLRDQQGFMLEFCIKIFTSVKEPVAVRVHAMQILYNISEKEPELKPEILLVIENEIENHSSAGIKSRGRKLTENLKKEIEKIKD